MSRRGARRGRKTFLQYCGDVLLFGVFLVFLSCPVAMVTAIAFGLLGLMVWAKVLTVVAGLIGAWLMSTLVIFLTLYFDDPQSFFPKTGDAWEDRDV